MDLGWRLDSDISAVLRAWDGPEQATLMFDGLDAHRNGPSWLADLVEELEGTRWRVIASIREFDLDHSLRWQRLFAGSPVFQAQQNGSARDQVRHAVVPEFDDRELSAVTSASPALESVLAAGDQRLRDLLRNPFNMSIAAELIAELGVEELAAMSTQVQILRAYWRARVEDGPGSYERRAVVRDTVEQMTRARSLEVVPRSALGTGAIEELVSRGVFEEARAGRLAALATPVRFRHHIVFDYALAAGVLGSGTTLADVLDADSDFVLFGRPAIDFHLADLWLADEDRGSFWDTALSLARGGTLLALAAAAAIAVQNIRSPSDFRRLISAAATGKAATAVVRHLACALGAVRAFEAERIDAWDELAGALGGAWLPDGQPREIQALLLLVSELDKLQPLPRHGSAAQAHAATITDLLETAIGAPASNQWIADQALRLITGALSLDSRALQQLRRCLDASVTAVWGLLPLRPVLARLDDVARTDGQTAALLAAAPFLFDASGHPDVPFGGSLITPMREQWEQAHGSLRYTVANSWEAFDAAAPRWSAEALAAILIPLSGARARIAPVVWNGVPGGVDCSVGEYLSDRDHVAEVIHNTAAAMASRTASGSSNTASLSVWAARIVHPGAWSALLDVAADEPTLAMELRSLLLITAGLFICPGSRPAAIKLAATLSPLLEDGEHAQLEQVAIALFTGETDPRQRQYLERARDDILLALDSPRIQTDEAAKLRHLASVTQFGSAVQQVPSPFEEDAEATDRWRLWGLDPVTLPALAVSAITTAEAALADGLAENDRWLALAEAVEAERHLAAQSDPRTHLRYQIGRLVSSLIGSQRMRPHAPAGRWAADLLLALSADSAFPPAPEDMC